MFLINNVFLPLNPGIILLDVIHIVRKVDDPTCWFVAIVIGVDGACLVIYVLGGNGEFLSLLFSVRTFMMDSFD